MSPIGEKLIEFLRSQSDVTEVRDESAATSSGQPEIESITCRHCGADYRVLVRKGYPR